MLTLKKKSSPEYMFVDFREKGRKRGKRERREGEGREEVRETDRERKRH